MKKFLIGFLACIASGLLQLSAYAATTEPTYHAFKFDDNGTISRMSDNGKWAVAYAINASNTTYGINPRLINLSDYSDQVLTGKLDPAAVISASAFDVTDDGKIVVGEFNQKPGYWKTEDNTWVELPLLEGSSGGNAQAVTPDGKYAIGNFTYEEYPEEAFPYKETAALWDLTTNQIVTLEGLPLLDMANENKKQNRFVEISADGNYIVGCLSISYWPTEMYAGGKSFYVYNVKEKSYDFIGFTPNDKGPWTPKGEGMIVVQTASMNNNGNWITGTTDIYEDAADGEVGLDYTLPYTYNVLTKEFVLLNTHEDSGVIGSCMTAEGTLLAATPENNPYREWCIRSGKYWIPISQVLKQKYNFDFVPRTGIENTGTPVTVGNDNHTIAVIADPYSSYVLTLPEDINTVCDNINLLGNYSIFPLVGSSITKLQKLTVLFDRDIEVLGNRSAVEIRNAAGQKVYSSIAFRADDNGKSVSVTFRNGTLEADQEYTVYIPAGSICLKGDQKRKNEEIVLNYTGRAATPVTVLKAVPENNATIAKIDAGSNPIELYFDTNVALKQEVSAQLFRADEENPFCELKLSAINNKVYLFPINSQMLYKGAQYKVVVPAGIITDVTGNNGNEEIVLNYTGAYEREISSDDKVLFSDNFDNGLDNFLLFDGDQNTPSELMQSWGFADAVNYPWSIVRDDEYSSDMAAASHSMYNPLGKSNDWMVIPQTYIPDNLCVLKFQSQSYMKDAQDKLKVIVWASDNVYNVLSATITEKILKEGTVVYDKLQTPGENEDLMAGDWTDNTIDLRDFAGKNVYIAFLNENEAQSAIFLNNVEVLHNIPFLVTFDNEGSVTAKSEITINGRITSDSETEIYQTATLTLKDASDKIIDVIEEKNLNLKKGETYAFSFHRPLPLTMGKENAFSVNVKMNQTENTIKSTVKNLSFNPLKRVVLEEFTGMSCPNCPLGILAISKIKSIYGKQFLPIALHCYPGDPLGTGLEAYSEFLGFSAAPSAIIQRNGVISAPMVSVEQDYQFNGVNGDKLWLDHVQHEMSIPADAEISATCKVSDKQIEVPCSIRYAMDTQNLNVNIFMAFVEDDIIGFQQNNLSGLTDPDLGDFGTGGKYGKAMNYPFYHNHVARGWYGNTLAGTGGLLPTTVEAGKTYTATIKTALPENIKDINKTAIVIMLINANTGKVINAVQIPANGEISGIEDATADNGVRIESIHHQILVNSANEAHVDVFTTAGHLIGQANGQGILAIGANGYQGVAIVKVTTAQETIVKKVML